MLKLLFGLGERTVIVKTFNFWSLDVGDDISQAFYTSEDFHLL